MVLLTLSYINLAFVTKFGLTKNEQAVKSSIWVEWFELVLSKISKWDYFLEEADWYVSKQNK
jgi:hypothetical protein